MTIDLRTFYGNERGKGDHFTAVESQFLNSGIRLADHLLNAHTIEYVLQQFHVSSITIIEPLVAFVPGGSD